MSHIFRSLLPGLSLTLALALPSPIMAMNIETSVGIGYDSNAFRSPDQPYTDYSVLLAPPAVTPQVQSGMYLPLEFKAASSNKTGLKASYDFSGDIYLNGLSNANSYTHEFRLANELTLSGSGSRRNTLDFGATLRRFSRTYYDRDSGLPKTSANRYSYTALGADAAYQQRISRGFQWGLDGEVEARLYDAVPTGSKYDYNIYKIGTYAEFRVLDPTRLRFDLDYTINDYAQFKARNLVDGQLSTTPRQDLFVTLQTTLRQRLGKDWTLFLDHRLRTRDDGFEGYDNYTAQRGRVRLLFSGDALKVRLSADQEVRSYDNAFAFNNVAQAPLDYTASNASLSTEYAVSKTWALWAEVDWRNVDTNDIRYAYARTQTLVGVRAEF
ncbi:MAG: hypothetical protein OEW11_04595 [Nitrospirota bacterium]|nr:hypothetical protein [Nitrospirota bacterium]